MEEAAEVSNLNEVMRKLKLHTDASAELDYGKENIDAAKNRRQSNPEFAHWSKGLKQGPRTFYPAGPGSVPNPPCNNYAMGPQTSQIQCGACGQFTSYIPADLYQPSTANPAVRDTNYARRSNELLPTLFTKNIPYGRTYYGVPHSRPYDRQGVHSDENWKQVPEQAVEPASFNGRIFPIHAADNFNTNTPATAELGPRMGGLGNRNSRSIVCNSGQYGKGDMALECEWRNVLNEQNRGPRAMRRQRSSLEQEEAVRGTGDKHYNLLDSLSEYEQAKFFVIKSYSEDDVHKSIKYNVWSSTRNGNKRLDVAYKDAQAIAAENSSGCPVFLLFSVNNSGQFCGVAEMIGPVDFGKSMDFWQQDRWMGCFPVKWHIIKDVPNSKLRHIIVENNDHKPVTNSRDTQEVKFEKGVEILSIFQRFKAETTILDDFFFYEQRYNTLQEIRATQHAAAAPTGCGSSAFR